MTEQTKPEPTGIVVRGARTHNLKDVSLELPSGRLAIITGVSGSVRSSLAFDTIHAEGQRRYVELLSAYARQFLERIEKPDVDAFDGVSPAIAIRQKTSIRNLRSTVATTTEIHDYLRLRYARVGRTWCRKCGQEVMPETDEVVAARLAALPAGTRILLGFDVAVVPVAPAAAEAADVEEEIADIEPEADFGQDLLPLENGDGERSGHGNGTDHGTGNGHGRGNGSGTGKAAAVVANAALIGIETSPALWERYGSVFHALNAAVQAIFVVEITVRLLAHGPRLHRFFLDGWNVFDFTIVALSLLPAAGLLASVARLARLLRALRVVSALPELRLIVATMLRSIPSLANVVVLLGLILYVYAVVGVHLFAGVDPDNWGSLPRAGLTLFEILTLEGWVELMNASLAATGWAWVYYVSFVVPAVFVVVNLFIAIVINNLEAAKREEHVTAPPQAGALAARLAAIREQLEAIESALRAAPDAPGVRRPE
jgi:voltage-gated sodium channel